MPYYQTNGDASPIGEIKSFMRTTAPHGYLICDGTTYNIGDYPLLEELFTSDFGSVNYFGGDGTTTWKVPDLRGEFLRGTGTNGHGEGSGSNVGVHQAATQILKSWGGSGALVSPVGISGNYYDLAFSSGKMATTNWTNASYSTENRLCTTRPTNTSVLYCIRAY